MSLFNIGFYHNIPSMYSSLCDIDPQIIGLIEEHDKKEDRLANAYLIMQNYQEGDVVLVETTEDQPYWDSQVEYVSKLIPLFGWDSTKAQKPIYDLSYKIHYLIDKIQELANKINSDNITENEFFQDVKQILDGIPKEYQFKAINILLSKETQLTYQCRKGIPFYLSVMVNKFGKREWSKIACFDPSRNQSLVEKIEKLSKIYKRIFIIAGGAHFLGEEVFGEQVSKNIEIVKNYLFSKKFIVLKPEVNKESIPLIESKLNQFKTINNIISWSSHFIKYSCSSLLNSPGYLIDLIRNWYKSNIPSHWNKYGNSWWHPNSWMERLQEIQLMEYKPESDQDHAYSELVLTFFNKYKIQYVEN